MRQRDAQEGEQLASECKFISLFFSVRWAWHWMRMEVSRFTFPPGGQLTSRAPNTLFQPRKEVKRRKNRNKKQSSGFPNFCVSRQARLEPEADWGSARAAAEALQEGDEEEQPDGGGLHRRQLALHHKGGPNNLFISEIGCLNILSYCNVDDTFSCSGCHQ